MSIATQKPFDLSHLAARLKRIYGEQADRAFQLISDRINAFHPAPSDGNSPKNTGDSPWNEADIVMITYGDQVSDAGGTNSPLATFREFLRKWQLPELINTVHFLPFFPYSSDDGFSVIDYRSVDPDLGSWHDVREIGRDCQLMFDFVVNHVSQESEWFQGFIQGKPPYDRFFIAVDPSTDLANVTRPRSLPLLNEFETVDGPKHVWTTFSRDQVDLNYADPELLAEVVSILLEYVSQGARIIRLDAIAYLWKEIGSTCIHLSQTHEVVKLMRDVMEAAAPHVLLLTETNVPHEENVSYFGAGDEAHMVYQFSLPPLLLDAYLHADATPLKKWLATWQAPPSGATYFNFTASHDGIGVRPLEGHIDGERLSSLVEKIKARGGHVGTRREADGSDSPYELNISYIDALADVDESSDDDATSGSSSSDAVEGDHTRQRIRRELQLERFLASQTLMLALQGMPAVYFHSLVGTPNHHAGVEESGIPRRINRRKYTQQELDELLDNESSMQRRVFDSLRERIGIRIKQPAFHPDASQRYVDMPDKQVVAFERVSRSGQSILVVANFGVSSTTIQPPSAYRDSPDLLGSSVRRADKDDWTLHAAQVIWMEGTETDG